VKNIDSKSHVTGESCYIDDLRVPEDTLYAHVVYSKVARGKVLSFDIKKASSLDGVYKIVTASDIPGVNQIGGIIPDEPLLAEKEIDFFGQPLAFVIAKDALTAKKGAALVSFEIEELDPLLCPRIAARKKNLFVEPMTFQQGDLLEGFNRSDTIVEGSVETGGQEHLYLETQGAIAIPSEGGKVHLFSSTQGPSAVQRTTAAVLGIPMNLIEVDVLRLGGAFGGKEDQATPWAVMAALGATLLKRPVKLVLERSDDMRMTGKRHPYLSDFKIGLKKNGGINAFEVTYYQNGGAAADLSLPVLGRTLFHACNAYYIPNFKGVGYSCKTNVTPNTAFRGFGAPQGKFVIESAIRKAAEVMGMDPITIQKKNLLKDGDLFHYGQPVRKCRAKETWKELEERYRTDEQQEKVRAFNKENSLFKKGVAFMPICFGISFTKKEMNKASALVHIYGDGTVGISTGAVEMGQGVNTKILQVVSKTLNIPHEYIKMYTTNTNRVANTSPTAASSGSDLNGRAVENACLQLLQRLKESAAGKLGLSDHSKITFCDGEVYNEGRKAECSWSDLITYALEHRQNLSAQGYYATPNLFFDKKTSKGNPFAYHVYGASFTEVTLDVVRGRYEIDSVKIVHDGGDVFNYSVDLGQVEGALVQGIGWLTLEEVLFDDRGVPTTDTLSAYKVPDIYAAPKVIETHFLKSADNSELGILNSKGVGEPPFMYGVGTFFALREAMKSFRPDKEFELRAPLTPERVLMGLYN
jgi:xanthine dehydrogenase large subunit